MRISDWSSDVCSSDLGKGIKEQRKVVRILHRNSIQSVLWGRSLEQLVLKQVLVCPGVSNTGLLFMTIPKYRKWPPKRSEERRVGKEWVSTGRSRWLPYH